MLDPEYMKRLSDEMERCEKYCQDVMSPIKNGYLDYIADILAQSDSMRVAMATLSNYASFFDHLVPQEDSLEKWFSVIQNKAWHDLYDSIKHAITENSRLFEASIQASAYSMRILKAMTALGWMPSITSSEVLWSFIDKEMWEHREKNDEDFGKVLLVKIKGFFKALPCDAFTSVWQDNPLISKRIPIIKQVVQAHKRGLYLLSIPVQIIQIEGMLWSAYCLLYKRDNQGQLPSRNGKYESICKLSGSLLKEDDVKNGTDSITNTPNMLKSLFRRETDKPIIDNDIMRHSILHGENTTYGNWQDSAKLL